VEIVGGNTRVPMVKALFTRVLDMPLSTTCDSDEGVVRGCTLECATLSSSFKVSKVFRAIDICSYPINLCWEEDGEEKKLLVFKAGDKLPCLKEIPFRRDSAFTLKLKYARDKMAEEGYTGIPLPASVPDLLGTFTVQGNYEGYLKEYPQERTPRVKVRVSLDKNGLAYVREADLCLRYVKEEKEQKKEEKKEEKKEGEGEGAEAPPAEETKEEKKEDKKKKKKTKVKAKALEVVSSFTNGFTPEQLTRLKAHCDEMTSVDDVARLREEANNALESYLLSTKSLINRGELDSYASEENREALLSALVEAEDWLYDYGWEADHKGLTEKLAEVEAKGAPYFGLKATYEQTAEQLSIYGRTLAGFASVLEIKHLTDDDKKAVSAEQAAGEAWIAEAEAKLASDRTSVPTVTAADVEARKAVSVSIVDPIKHKPVPVGEEADDGEKEEKEEEKKEEEKEEEPKEILALM